MEFLIWEDTTFIIKMNLLYYALLCYSKTMRRSKRKREPDPGDRPHKCEVCGKSFRKKFELDRHYVVHTSKFLILQLPTSV